MPRSAPEYRDALVRCPLFGGMSASERAELSGLLEPRAYQPGDVILQEGQTLQILGVLLSGECVVSKSRSNGQQHELARLEPLDVFGEISFFHPGPHSATVRCLTPVTAMQLSRDKFDLLLRVGSHAAYKLAYNSLSVLAERLRHMDELAGSIVEQSEQPREEWREFQSKMYSGWKF